MGFNEDVIDAVKTALAFVHEELKKTKLTFDKGSVSRAIHNDILEKLYKKPHFSKPRSHVDFLYNGKKWELKTSRTNDNNFAINQSMNPNGINFLIVNLLPEENNIFQIRILKNAKDKYFTPRNPKANIRGFITKYNNKTTKIYP